MKHYKEVEWIFKLFENCIEFYNKKQNSKSWDFIEIYEENININILYEFNGCFGSSKLYQ